MSNNLELLVRAYVAELQALDTAATDLLTDTTLDGAEGVQLDGLGQIIGIERNGLDDEPYRSLLRAYIRINTSGGTIEDINAIVRFATNTTEADAAFSLTDGPLAEFLVVFSEILSGETGQIAAEAMYAGKAAGVHAVFEYHTTEPIFAFDGAGGADFGTATSLPGNSGYYLKTAIRNRGARESEIL